MRKVKEGTQAVKIAMIALLVIILPAGFLSCGGTGESEDESPVLKLAMSGAYRPLSMTDAEGNLVGFDADIATEVATRMGYEAELVQTEWAGIQAGLQTSKYDLICGSMAITDERLDAMHFSLPYYISGAQVYVKQGITDLDGLRIGVTESTTYEQYIESHPELFPNAEVLRYDSEAQIVSAMNTDKIDCFVSDRIVGGFYIQEGGAGDIEPFGDLLYMEHLGIAARKDSPELVHEVNATLEAMIDDGTYEEIYMKWVGLEPDLEQMRAIWEEHEVNIPPLESES